MNAFLTGSLIVSLIANAALLVAVIRMASLRNKPAESDAKHRREIDEIATEVAELSGLPKAADQPALLQLMRDAKRSGILATSKLITLRSSMRSHEGRPVTHKDVLPIVCHLTFVTAIRNDRANSSVESLEREVEHKDRLLRIAEANSKA